ncbi:MAG: tetratricopeptide repeat protein [Rhizomicrobium sp.]
MLQQLIQQALALHRAGRVAEAEPLYFQILALDKDFYPALHLLGLLRLHQGRPGEALSFIEQALHLKPGVPEMLANRGIALEGLGRHQEALEELSRVVEIQPASGRAWSNRGALLSRLDRHREALDDFDRATRFDPSSAEAWYNRGVVLARFLRHEEALESYDRVLRLRPDHADARNNRGLALEALSRNEEALDSFESLLKEKPEHAGFVVNRASVLRALERPDEALKSYDRALELDPTLASALASRSNLLWTRKGDIVGALRDAETLFAGTPGYPYALGDMVHLRMQAGQWQGLEAARGAIDEGVRKGEPVVHPYVYQAISSSMADLLTCARSYAARTYPAREANFKRGSRSPRKIRLGYVSGEFRAQATMYLATGLFEHHDRERFEVLAFDNGRDDASPERARVKSAFDRFHSIRALSDGEAARLIEREAIDILVNLNGYFGAMRMGVFAHRPAPIQVNYLGFPGTLGADYIDYILADAEVIPQGEERFYSEKVVRLPDSYQINDNRRPVPAPASRDHHGLKEGNFVFCHFNYAYKIAPEMFALWLKLMADVPGSVLWLLESNVRFSRAAREEAAHRGVDPARIVFAPELAHHAHLSRLGLGDLFLDSLPYNAHTTASDALWAGLPLLTCRGTTFPGRVAASLLAAVGMKELIAETMEDYEHMALELARNPVLLASYRARLLRSRALAALFDTARTTAHIEAAYETMMTRWRKDEAPAAFAVRPG